MHNLKEGPALDRSENCDASAIAELKVVVEKLRSEDGCAWDKVQTHESLKAACIEEAAEVVHVFGDMKYASEEELHKAWAEIKKKEKAGREWEEEYLEAAMNEAAQLIRRAKDRKGFE